MSKIWSGMLVLSIIVAFFCGGIGNISDIIMNSSINATENIIKLLGMTCFWSGMFNILEKTSLISKISNCIKKCVIKLFNKQEINEKAMENISLTMTCDMLGVGNAATIYGIKAMEELDKENKHKGKANDNMVIFAVLNAASIQIIPTGIIALRTMYNSEDPVKIVPYVWLVTVVALIAGIISSKVLNKIVK